jgi:hypothetical protein
MATYEQHLTVERAGEPVVEAVVAEVPDGVDIHFQVQAGHVPVEARPELVAAVFALPEVTNAHELHAAVPLGDVQLLDGLREHCDHMQTRAAGVTCLVEAVVTEVPVDR